MAIHVLSEKTWVKKSNISACFLEIHSNRTNNEFVNINEGEIAMSSGLCKIQFVGVFIFCSSFKRELMRVSFQSFKLSQMQWLKFVVPVLSDCLYAWVCAYVYVCVCVHTCTHMYEYVQVCDGAGNICGEYEKTLD